MATIIDSLVVELGLDSSKFTKGQQQAIDALRKLQEQAEKSSKGIKSGFENLSNDLSKLTSYALKFSAALLGAKGIEETFIKITQQNNSLSKTAEVIGVNSVELSKWEGVARRAGGSVEEIRGAFQGAAKAISEINVTGPNTEFFQWLNKLGVNFRNFTDQKGQLSDFTGFFEKIGEGMKKLPEGERVLAAGALGLGNQNIVLFNQNIKKMLDDQEKIGFATNQQIDDSRQLVNQWVELQERMENVARILTEKVTPAMTQLLQYMNRGDPGPSHPSTFNREDRAQRTADLNRFRSGAVTKSLESVTNSSGVAAKSGANIPLGLYSVAQSISELPQFKQITAGNDEYHRGLPSAHNRGLALDFTLRSPDPRLASKIEAELRKKLAELGIDAKVLNEYDPKQRGPHTTAPHLHLGFANQAAVAKFNQAKSEGKINFHIENLNVRANNAGELARSVTSSAPVNNVVQNNAKVTNQDAGFQ